MPLHREFKKTEPQKLPPGDWRSLRFDVDDRGAEGKFYALVGQDEPQGALYDLSVGVVLEGVDPGAEVQLRVSEFVKTRDEWVVARHRPVDSPVHAGGKAHFTYSWKGFLEPGRRARVQVAQFGKSQAVVLKAEATVIFWPEGVAGPGAGQPAQAQAAPAQPYGQPGHYPPPQAPGAYPPPQAPGAYPPPGQGYGQYPPAPQAPEHGQYAPPPAPPAEGGYPQQYPPQGQQPPEGEYGRPG